MLGRLSNMASTLITFRFRINPTFTRAPMCQSWRVLVIGITTSTDAVFALVCPIDTAAGTQDYRVRLWFRRGLFSGRQISFERVMHVSLPFMLVSNCYASLIDGE